MAWRLLARCCDAPALLRISLNRPASRRDLVFNSRRFYLSSSAASLTQNENPIYSSKVSTAVGVFGGLLGLHLSENSNVGICELEVPGENYFENYAEEWEAPIVKEEMTGCTFPRDLSGTERLVSAGARLMTPLKIRVYAVGVYMDPVAGKLALKKWDGLQTDELLKEEQIWKVMCAIDSQFDRTIRMVVVREVDGSHMQNGFSRGLSPRVQKARKEQGLQGGSAALKALNKFFLKKKLLKEGCEILFRWSGSGTLDVYMDSKFYGRIESPALCWSIWDMFLGSKTVTPHLKSQVAAGIPKFLQ